MHKSAVIGVAVLGGLSIALPGNAGGNKYANSTETRSCDNGDVIYTGPLKLWPPNHKFVPTTVVAVNDSSSETTSLEVNPQVTDAAGGDGGSKHDPDVSYTSGPAATGTGTAAVGMALRAERSGRGDGRTYTIDWIAEFGDETCTSQDTDQTAFIVVTPHDMRGGADWK